MLIKRVYEIDPLECPRCRGQMTVVAFIEPRAPERSDGRGDVIEKILRHCGLWRDSSPRPPPAEAGLVYVADDGGTEAACCDGPEELALVADPDWHCPPPADDVPWEVTGEAYGDPFDASF
jgi:hypothetical protein